MHDPRKIVLCLEQITGHIAGGRDLDATLDGIVSAATEILHARRCSILLKSGSDLLRMRAARGVPRRVAERTRIRVGEGIAGRVAQTGEAQLLTGAGASRAGPRREGYATDSAICAPLQLRGEVLGVINLSDKRDAAGEGCVDFDEDDLLVAVVLANQAAIAIEAARALETAREHTRMRRSVEHLEQRVDALEGQAAALEVIRQVTDLIASAGDLDEVLERIVRGTAALLGARRGALRLIEPGSDRLRVRAAVGWPEGVPAEAPARWEAGSGGAAALCRSALCVPLRIQGQVIGALEVQEREDAQPFQPSDLFVSQLIANQAALAIAHGQLLDESVAAAEARRSLGVAREIQRSFIPGEPGVPGFRVAGRSVPCDETGGDYIDFGPRGNGAAGSNGTLFVAIGDVSGHGLGSALIMATSRAFLRALLAQGDDLGEVFERLNRLALVDFREGRFLTLFAALADPLQRRLVYTSAGHVPALLQQGGALQLLEATGPPLGILPEAQFPTRSVAFGPGDLLVLTTDGVWDARNEVHEAFGSERLSRAVREVAGQSVEALADALERRVRAFCGSAPQRDDVSVVVVWAEDGAAG